jgi:hypothetical protein
MTRIARHPTFITIIRQQSRQKEKAAEKRYPSFQDVLLGMTTHRTSKITSMNSLLLKYFIIANLLVVISFALARNRDEWLTTFERSAGTETPRYDETVAFCKRLADAAPGTISYRPFGFSPEGRELPMLVVHVGDTLKSLRLLVICGIHAGEIDGKDAGLMLIRDILIFGEHADLLDGIELEFIPIFNVDGHERFSSFMRINQNGPQEMGWRTTAQNLNLNRDFLKADAPEMRALLSHIQRSKPDFLMDIHVTDGADYQYVITYSMNDHANDLPPLYHYDHDTFLPAIKADMKNVGYDLVPQISFRDDNHPLSGWESGPLAPRFSTGYGTVINRPSLLVETHSLKDYRTRVAAVYQLLLSAIETLKSQKNELLNAESVSDSMASNLAGTSYALNWDVSSDSTIVEYKSVNMWREKSGIGIDSVMRWGRQPQTLRIPFFETAVPHDTITVPFAYILPQEWIPVLEPTLSAQGVYIHRLFKALTLPVERYRLSNVIFANKPYEGRFRVTCSTETESDSVTYPQDTGVILLNDWRAQVAIHLFEPKGPDSFLQWGFLNQIFEQKEYAEPYILDSMATRMMNESPQLAAEFQAKLKSDSLFAQSDSERYQFFYEHSPYWDTNKNLYPIARVTRRETVEYLSRFLDYR